MIWILFYEFALCISEHLLFCLSTIELCYLNLSIEACSALEREKRSKELARSMSSVFHKCCTRTFHVVKPLAKIVSGMQRKYFNVFVTNLWKKNMSINFSFVILVLHSLMTMEQSNMLSNMYNRNRRCWTRNQNIAMNVRKMSVKMMPAGVTHFDSFYIISSSFPTSAFSISTFNDFLLMSWLNRMDGWV